MDITGAYSAMHSALIYGPQYSYIPFLQILIMLLRPDIVDKEHRVKIVPAQAVSKSYDFIIIGGGSAGSVLANRLTENGNWTVLLLEAGADESVISDVSALASILGGTSFGWSFKTESSFKYCLSDSNNQCDWPRGKGLGGSSMHNAMLYIRGNKIDYERWRDLGNPGWGYDDVLPYFKKSEDMRIPYLRNSPYHGTGGYLTVEKFRYVAREAKFFTDAGRDMGYDEVDVNGATQTGFLYSQGTLRDGLRCSSAKAFLRSASHRKNLYVSTNSMVDKILINEITKTAYGVQFHRGGKKYFAYARAEVILSAGAVQSPQILMLSGIGPKKHLQEIGINVIYDSPGVGQNLQDHVAATFTYSTAVPFENPVPTHAHCKRSSNVVVSAADQFLNDYDGQLYGATGSSVAAFINTRYANSTLDFPDVRMGFTVTTDHSGASFSKQFHGKRNDFVGTLYGDVPKNFTYTVEASLMRPKSKGYIKLRDADPNHQPLIVPNYFHEPYDLDVFVEAIKLSYNFSQTRTMKKLNAQPNFNSIPECAHFIDFSDDYWNCYARYLTATGYHPCCTCKMGPANDSMAVVDSRLRAYGVSSLRVIDASVMPNIVSGNTNAPTIMIAEKAADLIKEDYYSNELKRRMKAGNPKCRGKE